MMDTLLDWKANPNRIGLTIVGPRYIGKTTLVERFGRENYGNYLRLDLARAEERRLFSHSLDADDILRGIGVHHPGFTVEKGDCLLFLDSIGLCPEARSAIKPLVETGELDVIASDSLLRPPEPTRRGRQPKKGRTLLNPMGYEIVKRMHAMDFEEYLWAMGVSRDLTDEFRRNIENREPFDPDDLEVINRYFRQFIVVGGMPEAVRMSLSEDRTFEDVMRVQRSLNQRMTENILDHAPRAISLRCLDCIGSIPRQLGRANKRFMFNEVRQDGNKVGMREYADPIAWISSAGFVNMCPNLTEPVRPLTPRSGSMFKLYMYDTGLLLDMMGDGTRTAVFDGDLTANNGAVMENAVASMIDRSGFDLFYFERNRMDKDGKKDRI